MLVFLHKSEYQLKQVLILVRHWYFLDSMECLEPPSQLTAHLWDLMPLEDPVALARNHLRRRLAAVETHLHHCRSMTRSRHHEGRYG